MAEDDMGRKAMTDLGIAAAKEAERLIFLQAIGERGRLHQITELTKLAVRCLDVAEGMRS